MTTVDRSRLVEAEAAVELRSVSKQYGAVEALRSVSLQVDYGRIVALAGDNGAGKSTLLKILAGAVQPTSGDVLVDGDRVAIGSPSAASRLGVGTVYQDLALVPSLSIAENMFLGSELTKQGVLLRALRVLDRRSMEAAARESLQSLRIEVPSVKQKVRELSGGQQQAISIGRAAHRGHRILLLDEPTAALGVVESGRVVGLIRSLRDQGMAILIVSHNLDEVLALADMCVVLRQGTVAGSLTNDELNAENVLSLLHKRL